MEFYSSLFQMIQSIVTTVAILVGGGWAYREYVRRRDYVWNVDVTLQPRLTCYTGDKAILVLDITMKNIGKQVFSPGPKGLQVGVRRIGPDVPSGTVVSYEVGDEFLHEIDLLEQYLKPDDVAAMKKDYVQENGYHLDVNSSYLEQFRTVVDKEFIYMVQVTLWGSDDEDDYIRNDLIVPFTNTIPSPTTTPLSPSG